MWCKIQDQTKSKFIKYSNHNPQGGFAEPTFQYIIDQNGIDSLDSYSYEDGEGTCRYNSKNSIAKVKGYHRIKGDEEYLKKAIAEVGPMVVGVKSDLYTFYGYSEGIFDDKECYGGVNHAVCLIGKDIVVVLWDFNYLD